MCKEGRIVVLSAPSGCGKSTIIHNLLEGDDALPLEFSVSATNRAPRTGEADGVSYHFLSTEAFLAAVAASYNPLLVDTPALKAHPEQFEQLRNDYSLRTELH